MTSSKKRMVACPQCAQAAVFSPENPHRPFCSERCRLIDLGQWANEQYRIPVEGTNDGMDEDSLLS